MKKLTCLLLVLCLVASLAPVSALAQEEPEPAEVQEEPFENESFFLPEEESDVNEENEDLTAEDPAEETESDGVAPEELPDASLPEEVTSEETTEKQTMEAVPELPEDELSYAEAAPVAGPVETAPEAEPEGAVLEAEPEETAPEAGPEETAPEAGYEETQPENADPELPVAAQTDEKTPTEERIAESPVEELLIWDNFEGTDEDNSDEENPMEETKAEDQPTEESESEETREKQPEINDENREERAETSAKKLIAEEEKSSAEKKDAVQQNTNRWTLKTIDGSTITQDTYKKKIQLLIFYRGGMENGEGICMNSSYLIYQLADAWWTANKDVQVIAVESSGCTRAETIAHKKTYAPNDENVVFAYDGEDLMENLVNETYLSGYYYLNYCVCFILKQGAVMDCWEAAYDADECEEKIRSYVDLGTDPRLKLTKVEGTFNQTEARKMLKMINDFRTTKKVWYWNSDNSAKTVLNTSDSNTLAKLSYDYDLEQLAMKRAQELAVLYAHVRPNKEYFSTLSVNGTVSYGENIAYCTSGYWDANGVFICWREDNEDYSGQGHRRNILRNDITTVGFGCYIANDGYTYWTQEFGIEQSGAAKTEANDSSAPALIEYNQEFLDYIQPYELDSLEKTVISKTSYGAKGITVRWKEVQGATEYQVSRRIKGGKWKALGTTTGLSFTDPNVDSGKTYQYRVRAKNTSLTGAYSKVRSVKYIGSPTITGIKLAKTAVTLKWKKAAGAAQTQIWRRVRTSGGWGSWKKLKAVTGTSYTDKGVKSGKTYQYKMKSVNSSGKEVNAYSNVKKIAYIAAPSLAKPVLEKGAVTLTWEKVPGAVKYRVFRKGAEDETWTAMNDLTKQQYKDTSVQENIRYSYAVRCISRDGTKSVSAMSVSRTVTTK